MHASSHGSGQSKPSGGSEMYFGYCQRSQRYRMMDLPDYVSNIQEGMSRWMNDSTSAYQNVMRRYSEMPRGPMMPPSMPAPWKRTRDCGCDDCHCECCVCDADVLMHARCGEMRRIPIAFENDTRREREVKLELGKFVSSGGRDLEWAATLSEKEFKLHPCGEYTVSLLVRVVCTEKQASAPVQPSDNQPIANPVPTDRTAFTAPGIIERFGTVDRCEVGYATIRAEGCLTRPIVVAVAVLPDDCDAYRHPCGCGCCD